MNNTIELTEVKVSDQFEIKHEIIRFAWGNEKLSTWFTTKSNRQVLPKGSRLLFVIYGKYTNNSINTHDTYPKIGDVICDLNGRHIEVDDVICL